MYPWQGLDHETWSLYNHRLQWDLQLATGYQQRLQMVLDVLQIQVSQGRKTKILLVPLYLTVRWQFNSLASR